MSGFEQTQQTRVESKQWSGDWSRTIAPSGNGGPVSEPYFRRSVGLDASPLANGIDSAANIYTRASEEQQKSAEKARKEAQAAGRAELLEKLREINEAIPEGSKREEAVKKLFDTYTVPLGLDYHDIQNLRSYSGNDYGHSLQGMVEEEIKKQYVESEKKFATLAEEVRPETATLPFQERVKIGRENAKMRDQMTSTTDVLFNPNSSQEQKELAKQQLAAGSDSLLSTPQLRDLFEHPELMTMEQTQTLSNVLSASWINKGYDPTEAQANAIWVANQRYKMARKQQMDLQKVNNEEKENMIKGQVLAAQSAYYSYLVNARPNITPGMSEDEINKEVARASELNNYGLMLALHKMDPADVPGLYEDLKTLNVNVLKYDYKNGVRTWVGDYDSDTASFGVQKGTPLTVVAALSAMQAEARRRNTPEAYRDLEKALNLENVEGILTRLPPGPALDNAKDVFLGGEAELLAQEIRNYMLETTAAGEPGKVKDLGVFNTREEINNIIDRGKERLHKYGANDDDQMFVAQEALKKLGIKQVDVTTNPEEMFEIVKQKSDEFNKQSWHKVFFKEVSNAIQDPFQESLGIGSARKNMRLYKDGKITKEQLIERLDTAYKSIPTVNKDDESSSVNLKDVLNLESKDPLEPLTRTQNTFKNIVLPKQVRAEESKGKQLTREQIENKVISSKEFQEAVRFLQQDQQMTPEEKSVAANNTLKRMVDNLMTESPDNFRVAKLGSSVKNFNIFNTRGKNKASGFVKFKNEKESIKEAIIDAKTKVERFKGDVMKLCNQYAPREDNNLTTRYCCGLLYRTPGVSEADKITLNEIAQQIKDAPEKSKQSIDKSFEDVVAHFANKYKHLFWKDGTVQTVRPIVQWQALMETGTQLEFVDND